METLGSINLLTIGLVILVYIFTKIGKEDDPE